MSKKTNMPIVAKKSCNDGHVSISVKLNSRGWNSDNVKIDGRTAITTSQARELAKTLIQCADEAEKKVADKAAHEERRKKYREREIKAGRLIVFGGFGK